jgi:uncharacterized protein YidB (DUF937 family)
MPSMTALLAVLAMAGYQNRDKLAEMLGGAGARRGPPEEAGRAGGTTMDGTTAGGSGSGGMASGMAGGLGGAGIGGFLANGLQELLDRFRETGQGETADSWVARGPNRPVEERQLEAAIGPETLETLSRQTGLPREEILARLKRELPTAVDQYPPEGRLPDA